MKKFVFFTLLSLSVAVAQTDSYLLEADGLISDAKKIETALLDKSLDSLSSDSDLQEKLSAYELKSAAFVESLTADITDPALAEQILNKTEALSQSVLSLAKSITDLADKTSTNANSSYLTSLETMTQTTLRLSDDIGLMADRIGDMADRIVYTEELISKNAEMINKSMLIIIDKFDFKKASAGENSLDAMPASNPMPVAPPVMPVSPF